MFRSFDRFPPRTVGLTPYGLVTALISLQSIQLLCQLLERDRWEMEAYGDSASDDVGM